MNKVFFSTEGLTSTSANHIANIAKEYAQRIGNKTTALRLYTKKARLLADESEAVIETPVDVLDIIPDTIKKISKCNALIGWLREAIKEREDGLNEIRTYDFARWTREQDIIVPVVPEAPKPVGDIDKVGNEILNVKERNRYIELKTILGVYGDYIHPHGILPKAQKEVEQFSNNPTKIQGEGRDMVVYSYDVEPDAQMRLTSLFFQLQGEYRALQAELNGIEHRFRMEAEKEYAKRQAEYKSQFAAYREAKENYDAEMQRIREQFAEWQIQQTDEIEHLKIIIPNDLQGIYTEVSGL